MNKIHKNDTVRVMSGNDKGKTGSVHAVLPSKNKVIVEGVNLIKKAQKRAPNVRTQAGIIEREGPISISNVRLICKNCGKPTRVGLRVLPEGRTVRFCKKCDQVVD